MSRGIYWLIFLVFVLQMAGLCVRFGFLLPALSDLTN